jgi:V-type H+-transporting ATPase subunit C
MVVLFFTLSKQKLTYSTREFADYLKGTVLSGIDKKKVIPLELGIMKDLVTDNLDSLLKINDELIKNDSEIESFLKNLEKKIYELDPKQELSVNIKGTIVKIEEGISQFSWDESRYPKNQKTIPDILNKINEKFNATFQNLKAKTEEYTNEDKKLQLKKKRRK